MACLRIHLLGEVRVYRDKEPVALPTRKIQALLAYLITHHDRAHSRQKLMGLFWGESPEKKARDSLYNAISVFRRALGPNILIAQTGSIGLNPRSAALLQYERCCKILRDELSAEPLPETIALCEEIKKQSDLKIISDRLHRARLLLARYPELGAPFVGRADELAKLLARWQNAKDGRGGIILIHGEAGIGKTRLVHELLGTINKQECSVLIGNCHGIGLPYQPLIEALRDYLRSEASLAQLKKVSPLADLLKLLPELGELFPQLRPNPPLPPEEEQRRFFNALTQFLTISINQPLLILLDDLHLADTATLQYLRYLAHYLSDKRILLLGTYRTEEVDEAHPLCELISQLHPKGLLDKMSLKLLTLEEVSSLVKGMLRLEGAAAPQAQNEFAQKLYQETEGNPFFIMELIKSLIEGGALYVEEGRWHIPSSEEVEAHVPAMIKELISTRLRRVSQQGRELLEMCAVAGQELNLKTLLCTSSSKEEALLKTIEELRGAYLLEETERGYNFVHELIRQVVYGGLSLQKRRHLHLRVAQALEGLYLDRVEGISGEVAHHFEQAQAWPEALKYLLQAGERAKCAYANHEALNLFRRALTAIDQLMATKKLRQQSEERLLMKRFDIMRARVEIYQLLGHLPEQEPDLAEMLKLATRLKDWRRIAEAHLRKAEYCQMAGCYPEAEEELKRALAIHRKLGDRRGEGLALRQLGFVHESLGEYKEALKHYRQAHKIFTKSREKQGQASALTRMATMLWDLGDVQKALESAQKSNEIFKELGDLPRASDALTSMAIIYDNVGQDAKALEYHLQALKLRQEVGDRRREASALNNLGDFYRNRGKFAEALEYEARALPLWQETNYKRGEAATLRNIAIAQGELGNYQKALACFDESLQISREFGLKDQEIENLIWRSQQDLSTGEYQDAYERSKQAIALLEAGGHIQNKPLAYWYHFRVLEATNRREEATTYLRKAYEAVMAEAKKLKDRAMRESFLTNVKTNREIVGAWEEHGAQANLL